MGFSSNVADYALERANYRCQACGRHWSEVECSPGDCPLDLHSASTLHIVRRRSGIYVATSVPDGHGIMKSRRIPPHAFAVQRAGREDDAFVFCIECHSKVHLIEEEISRNFEVTGDGKNAIPQLLESITLLFVATRGKWTYS